MIGVFSKRRILMRCGSQGNQDTAAYTTTPDHIIQSTTQDMVRPSASASTSIAWWVVTVAPLTGGCSSIYPSTFTLDWSPRAQTILFEEENHQCERRVASLRTEFRKLSDGRENKSYKGNTRMFWKVLLSIREFQFLTF